MKKNTSIKPRGDLTALRKRVAMLEKSEKRLKKLVDHLSLDQTLFHALFDNTPDRIYFKDTDCRITKVNKAWARHKGLSGPRDAVGKTDFDFFDKKFAKQTFEEEQRIMRTKEPLIGKIECVASENGLRSWFSATKVPVVDSNGNVIGTCGITRDFTDLKGAEAEILKKERNLLRTLIDAMPDYIFVKDAESRFVVNNRAHLDVLGAKNQSDLAGKSDVDIFPAQLAARYLWDERNILQSKKPIINREEQAQNRDGTKMWLSTTKVPLLDHGGKVSGFVGISRNITERKKVEKALQEAKAGLEVRVEERTLTLKNVNEILAERVSQLQFLNETSFALSQSIQIGNLGPEIVKAFTGRFPRAEAALFVRNQGKFDILGATPRFHDPDVELAGRKALSLLNESTLSKPTIISDWTRDSRYASMTWPAMTEYPCYMVIPLVADKKCIAVVQMFSMTCPVPDAELPVLNTLAATSAACLNNALNYLRLEKSARQQGELSAAQAIQQRFSALETPTIPSLRFKGFYLPANEVGGDYLDCFETNRGDWVIVIADVCGNGMPAALFMSMLRSACRILGRSTESARDLICAVNEEMLKDLTDRTFVTALCLVIKKDGSSMSYARAGHPCLIRQRQPGKAAELIKVNGCAMGIVDTSEQFCTSIEELSLPLAQGNRFLIYTDGVTEANNLNGELYGSKRLLELLANDSSATPATRIEHIVKDISTFQKGTSAGDDLTVLAMDVA